MDFRCSWQFWTANAFRVTTKNELCVWVLQCVRVWGYGIIQIVWSLLINSLMHRMEIRRKEHNYSEQSESKQCLGLPSTLKANYVEHTDFSQHKNRQQTLFAKYVKWYCMRSICILCHDNGIVRSSRKSSLNNEQLKERILPCVLRINCLFESGIKWCCFQHLFQTIKFRRGPKMKVFSLYITQKNVPLKL